MYVVQFTYNRSIFTSSNPSQYVRARPDLHHHVLLHQIETHGDQCHAEHQVHGAQNEAELDAFYGTGPGTTRVGHVAAGYEVTEPDGAQRYETEIRSVEELPIFPFRKQHGTTGYVPGKIKCKSVVIWARGRSGSFRFVVLILKRTTNTETTHAGCLTNVEFRKFAFTRTNLVLSDLKSKLSDQSELKFKNIICDSTEFFLRNLNS